MKLEAMTSFLRSNRGYEENIIASIYWVLRPAPKKVKVGKHFSDTFLSGPYFWKTRGASEPLYLDDQQPSKESPRYKVPENVAGDDGSAAVGA
jgi:hypothetical protein